MKRVYKYVTASIITGIFFLIPIGIVFIIFEKIFNVVKKIQVALHLKVTGTAYIHALINDVLVVLIILLLCFLAGLAGQKQWGKSLVDIIEKNVLQHLPGYDYTKSTAQGILGINDHRFNKVVLYRDDVRKYAIAFKVENVTERMIMIFIPSTPKPRDGELLVVDMERLIETELSMQQAFEIIKTIGNGAAGKLGLYFSETEMEQKESEN
ncbi:DUF502 domain-containing protein [Mucilaginibacter agri]|uniref:DUF502 domain-containing protein n=1 Tax=Mucilaginibacter agri TaxID=2695265 RepID=A0A966DWB3_9SPHI|nr:DUF502 domain-containing protein [Mucilaginibacter agri]NCD72356.1 DUF502 domain-containing protein [Mucilaginibacter agri]